MPSRNSEKPVVFLELFRRRYDAHSKTFSDTSITNEELQDLILVLKQEEGISLGVSNPANFLKDFLRSSSRNKIWPLEIKNAGFTARQAFGEGRVFDFIPMAEGQLEPFPDDFVLPEGGTVHELEAVSLSSAARALGRDDESWLIQVCVQQRVLQTHFSIYSALPVTDLFHLQNTLKGTTEIDAVFLLVLGPTTAPTKALITFEAKRKDPILPFQIRNQIAYLAKQCRSRPGLEDVDLIVPVAVATNAKKYGKGVVAFFEMQPISVEDGQSAFDADSAHDLPLVISNAVGYRFKPPVTGI